MDAGRTEASPIEIAVLLMDAVCTPSEQEHGALRQLATHLEVDLQRLQAELLYLRAFAVDFAMALALGGSSEREAVATRYYRHWDRIAQEAGEDVLEDLQGRLESYSRVIDDSGSSQDPLRDQIGRAFALRCQAEKQDQELALLGGAMFAAFFDEVTDLFHTVDIVLYEEDREGGAADNVESEA